MYIGVIGCGRQGRIVAQDLAEVGHKVTVYDNNIHYLRQLKKNISVRARQFNVKNKVKFIKILKNFDIIVGTLPAAFGYYTMDCAIKAGVDIVDVSYLSENPLALHQKAAKKQIRIVPDAGFAPGLSNILVGQAYKELKGIDTLKILAGGLPQNPVPPFNYCITWSPTDLIEEYTRPARILQNGKIKTVEALSGIEEFSLPRIGKFECFYTDGLRTLLHTLKNVKKMEEKTVRYPGHAGVFNTIIDCGFLSDEQVHSGKRLVNMHDITMEFLRNVLRKTDNKDISILKIQVSKGRRKRTYLCVDYYDEKNNITSMARMTAYTASMITQYIKEYNGYGVIPPEYLGMDDAIKKSILSGLRKHGIKIKSKK